VGHSSAVATGHIDVREVGDDGLTPLVTVLNAAQPRRPTTVSELVDWRRQAADAVWLLALTEGRAEGAGIGIHGWHSPQAVARAEVAVDPAARGMGIGAAILSTISSWALERGNIELMGSVREDDPGSLAWVEKHGFSEVGRNSLLVLDLTETDDPEPAPPAGIEIVSWADRPELAQGTHETALQAYPDVPGEENTVVPAFQQWLSMDMLGGGDRADGVFVALAAEEVVGYAKLAFPPARPDAIMHDITAVKRAWRRRGIAGALKRAEIAWAKRSGFRILETYNEERNEPIRRLNERFGYRLAPGTVTVRGPALATR
jgi:GNAT superfamily N-acetyltransferase